MVRMRNATSGVERKVLGNFHWLWSFLFGFIYYVSKGSGGMAIVSFFTANGLFIIMPLLNKKIITRHYEDNGWIIVRND